MSPHDCLTTIHTCPSRMTRTGGSTVQLRATPTNATPTFWMGDGSGRPSGAPLMSLASLCATALDPGRWTYGQVKSRSEDERAQAATELGTTYQ